jgi:hypothetical protein
MTGRPATPPSWHQNRGVSCLREWPRPAASESIAAVMMTIRPRFEPAVPDAGVRELSKYPCRGVLKASKRSHKYMIYKVFMMERPASTRFFPVFSLSGREA